MLKRFFFPLLVLACLASSAFAQDVLLDASSDDAALVSTPPAADSVSPTVEAPDMPSVTPVVAAYKEYRAAPGPEKTVAFFGLLASLTYFLLGGVKKLEYFVLDPARKALLPKIAMVLGVVAGLTSALALGQPWYLAMIYGAGPPMAVLVHEMFFQKKA